MSLSERSREDLFRDNSQQMGIVTIGSVLPPNVSMAGGIAANFNGAATNTQSIQPPAPAVAPQQASVDREKLVGDASAVGQTLREGPPQGDVHYGASQAMKIGGEAITALGSLFGSSKGEKAELNDDARRPAPQPVMAGLSPTGGGGMA